MKYEVPTAEITVMEIEDIVTLSGQELTPGGTDGEKY